MHPVNYLFEDIYRNWGLPAAERRKPANHSDAPAWQRRETKRPAR